MVTYFGGRGLWDTARRTIVGAARLLLGSMLLLVPVALALGRAGRFDPPIHVDRDGLPIRVGVRSDGSTWTSDRFLDPETGRPIVPSLPGGGEIWTSAWAPWADQSGRTQLVGFWKGSNPFDDALIRLSEPDGAVLDRLPVTHLPGWRETCWFPDRSARVLLAGSDGRIYRLDFDGADSGPLRPRPMAWRGGPETGVARINDLSWPRHPRFGGCLLTSLVVRDAAGLPPGPDMASVWWLRLDPEAAAVIAAGPLVRRAGLPFDAADQRRPVLSPAGAGPPALAWLERRRVGERWRLRVASVEVDPLSGDPSASVERARTLAEGCAQVAPAFSADGRRISYIAEGAGALDIRRVDVPDWDTLGMLEARLADVVANP